MIPEKKFEFDLGDDIYIVPMPSYTHKMHIEAERVKGHIDDELEAIKQMVYKCINTEKHTYPIYPQFGIKIKDLFGKRKEYAYVVLTLRIRDALMLDDRVEDVLNFRYHQEWSKEDNLGMSFKVKTIFSESPIEIKEVIRIG